MTPGEETERVEYNLRGEPSPPVEVRLVGSVKGDAGVCLSRVREVMRVVAHQRDDGAWPEDSWWEAHLPEWFLEPFRGRTMDEVLANPELWDFGSWLDAMKSPGWEWWSSDVQKEGWTIRLRAHSDPFSIGPLEYLARAAGADGVEVDEG